MHYTFIEHSVNTHQTLLNMYLKTLNIDELYVKLHWKHFHWLTHSLHQLGHGAWAIHKIAHTFSSSLVQSSDQHKQRVSEWAEPFQWAGPIVSIPMSRAHSSDVCRNCNQRCEMTQSHAKQGRTTDFFTSRQTPWLPNRSQCVGYTLARSHHRVAQIATQHEGDNRHQRAHVPAAHRKHARRWQPQQTNACMKGTTLPTSIPLPTN